MEEAPGDSQVLPFLVQFERVTVLMALGRLRGKVL